MLFRKEKKKKCNLKTIVSNNFDYLIMRPRGRLGVHISS